MMKKFTDFSKTNNDCQNIFQFFSSPMTSAAPDTPASDTSSHMLLSGRHLTWDTLLFEYVISFP